ncbi:MAG: Fur family transcriptional regulator [Acidimicrobiales bacterium]
MISGGNRRTTEAEIDSAMALIRNDGGRATESRRFVLEALIEAGAEHRTAEQLAAEAQRRHPDVHPATVYRALERFEDLGIAYHTHLGHGPAQWHFGRVPHPHLTCSRCGAVVEADGAPFAELASRLLATHGFEVDFGHFAVTGTCEGCR